MNPFLFNKSVIHIKLESGIEATLFNCSMKDSTPPEIKSCYCVIGSHFNNVSDIESKEVKLSFGEEKKKYFSFNNEEITLSIDQFKLVINPDGFTATMYFNENKTDIDNIIIEYVNPIKFFFDFWPEKKIGCLPFLCERITGF